MSFTKKISRKSTCFNTWLNLLLNLLLSVCQIKFNNRRLILFLFTGNTRNCNYEGISILTCLSNRLLKDHLNFLKFPFRRIILSTASSYNKIKLMRGWFSKISSLFWDFWNVFKTSLIRFSLWRYIDCFCVPNPRYLNRN